MVIKATKPPEPGEAYLMMINGKIEIALCIATDFCRNPEQGQYAFTYSHWNFDAHNWLTLDLLKKYKAEYSKAASTLYG